MGIPRSETASRWPPKLRACSVPQAEFSRRADFPARALLTAACGKFDQQRTGGGLTAHLRPQFGIGGSTAPSPNFLQGDHAARVAPPVLVMEVAQECAGALGQRPALQLRQWLDPPIPVA